MSLSDLKELTKE